MKRKGILNTIPKKPIKHKSYLLNEILNDWPPTKIEFLRFKDHFEDDLRDQYAAAQSKFEQEHMDRLFEEREDHCKLYGIDAKFQSAEKKIKEQQDTIVFQRDELNIMLERINKYHKLELKDYPADLRKAEKLNLDLWVLTREAKSDKEIIHDLT